MLLSFSLADMVQRSSPCERQCHRQKKESRSTAWSIFAADPDAGADADADAELLPLPLPLPLQAAMCVVPSSLSKEYSICIRS